MMLKNSPGQMRHQVSIYLPSTSVDAYGRRTGSDTAVLADVPASVEQLTALELIRARQVYAEATHRVRCTLYPDHGITSKHYLKFGTRKLNVGAVVDAENVGVEIELLCKEEV
jgi:SPP1 family predicted phage head-tail adaptor